MNERKLRRLFELAQQAKAPVAPEGFNARVMRAIGPARRVEPPTLWEQLGGLFPKLAMTAVAVVLICGMIDYWDARSHGTSLMGDLSALSVEWQQTGVEE